MAPLLDRRPPSPSPANLPASVDLELTWNACALPPGGTPSVGSDKKPSENCWMILGGATGDVFCWSLSASISEREQTKRVRVRVRERVCQCGVFRSDICGTTEQDCPEASHVRTLGMCRPLPVCPASSTCASSSCRDILCPKKRNHMHKRDAEQDRPPRACVGLVFFSCPVEGRRRSVQDKLNIPSSICSARARPWEDPHHTTYLHR